MGKIINKSLLLIGILIQIGCSDPVITAVGVVTPFWKREQTKRDARINDLEAQINELTNRVNALELSLRQFFAQYAKEHDNLLALISESQLDAAQLLSLVNNNTQSLDLVIAQLNSVNQQVSLQILRIDSLESSIVDQAAQLAELAAQTRIVEVIDPCGDNPSKIDEVGFKMADGSIYFYFIDNGGGRLSKLPQGYYRTTDGTNCNFAIDAQGNITY